MNAMAETAEHMNIRLEQSENTMNMINMMISDLQNLRKKPIFSKTY